MEKDKPLTVFFGSDFVAIDQDIADIKAGAQKPETRFCLVELPKEELETLLETGAPYHFKEQSGAGGAVLSTKKASFTIEFLENSNSLFIGEVKGAAEAGVAPTPAVPVDGGAVTDAPRGPATPQGPAHTASTSSCTVFAQCRGQAILKPARPDAARVRELLLPYALGQQGAPDGAPPEMTTEMLEYEVAASPSELKALLAAGPYVEHNGGWRFLSVALERDVVDAAVTIVTAKGWEPGAVNGEALLREVQQQLSEATVPSLAVLRKALAGVLVDQPAPADSPEKAKKASDNAATETADTGGETAVSDKVLVLDKTKMSRAQAVHLLREPPVEIRKRFNLAPSEPRAKRARLLPVGGRDGPPLQVTDFVHVFREMMGTETDTEDILKLVADVAYVDEFEGTIHPFDAASLPQDPRERLARLFGLQTHWKPECLERLILPVLGKDQKVTPWILKWTRQAFVEIDGVEKRMLTKKFAGL